MSRTELTRRLARLVDRGISRLLIIKMGLLGDVLQALPVAGALHRRFPDLRIGWLVMPRWAGLLEASPHLSEVIPFSEGEIRPLIRGLRRERFQVVLDLECSTRSALLGWASGARRRISYRPSHPKVICRLNNMRMAQPEPAPHRVAYYLNLASVLGAAEQPVDFSLNIPEPVERRAVELLTAAGWQGEPLAAIHPGGSRSHKIWPGDRFGAVAAALAGNGFTSVLVGSDEEAVSGEGVKASAGVPLLSLVGRTSLVELAAVFRRCRLMIGNDSGPGHLAAAVGVPVVTIFGPTSYAQAAPYGRSSRVVTADVSCSPCRNWECSELRCLKEVSADQVLAAAWEALAQPEPEVPTPAAAGGACP